MGFGDFFSGGGGSIIGSAIGAVGSLLGGHMSSNAAAQNAAQQYANQKEFAQNGVRWKVADAQAAGIHPLAALGAQTFSYNPVMTQYDNGVASALQQMGQGVDRAFQAKQLQEERELDKSLKAAQIENVNAQADAARAQAEASRASVARTALPPPMPRVNAGEEKSQGNIAQAKPKFMWVLNPDGKRELLPADDFVSAYEDKPFGLDLLPLFEAGARSLYGKLTDTPLDGYRWSWSDLDWRKDNRSVPSWSKRYRGSKGFQKNLENIGY